MNKELEALERIKKMYVYFINHYRDLEPFLMICEKEDFDIVENTLKALEIIKNKQVQVDWFIHGSKNYGVEGLHYYNNGYVSSFLTQEEFDLLKEVLL